MAHTRELAHETWSEYLDAASRELLGAPVSIEVTEMSGAPMVHGERLALQALSYDRRRDVFEVAVGRAGQRLPSVMRHFVERPQKLATDSATMLAPMTISVDGRDGARTVIRIARDVRGG